MNWIIITDIIILYNTKKELIENYNFFRYINIYLHSLIQIYFDLNYTD
jgi:hypothetical protein